MLHRITLLLLLVLPLLAPAPAQVEASHALRADTVARGVRLSLVVPRSVYPRGVITRVTIWVQNLSLQTVTVLPGCAGQFDNPKVESLTPSGAVRYPPAVPAVKGSPPMQPCTGTGSMGPGTLAPGASEQANALVILGASRLRAVITLAPQGAKNQLGRPFTIVGRTLWVRLVQAPRARIVPCSAATNCLRVVPPGAHVSGPLYYAYSARCEDAKGNLSYSQEAELEVMANMTLHVGCGARLAELHVVAGWLNHPVGRIDRALPGSGWSDSPVTGPGTGTFSR